ncbi:MAG TPA: VRR-NUC domain-containing protein [Burkholderiaceae bacterium]
MNNNLDHPFYYLENFSFVLEWVSLRYGDLLDAEEAAFIAGFAALPEASRGLLVRMVMRKGELFRASKLHYEEIGAIAPAVRPLVDAGWVEADPELTLEQLYGLLTRKEFAVALGLGAARTARKGDLYAMAAQEPDVPRRFSQWCADLADTAYEIRIGAICDRLRLMFFGNLYQDWSEFILSDLGIYAYEKIEFSADSRAFAARADIDCYLRIEACRELFHSGEEDEDADSELARLAQVECDIMAVAETNPWLGERRARLLYQLAQRLEQLGAHEQALRVYEVSGYSGARLRRIRVLEKSEHLAAAMKLAREAQAAPESAAEAQGLERMLPRLARKLALPRETARRLRAAGRIDLVLPVPTEDYYVEEIARAHFAEAEPQARVFYVENALINSLFGLLCWEAVFHSLPGAFFHPFQSGPADLHSADFRKRRAVQFDACLGKLQDGSYCDAIRANFADKAGLQSPFVYWQALDEDLLELALACIPADHLAHWFERILQDIAANRTGFPDLIQFWPEEKRYRMVEIKGPGDRLQDNQIRLIDFALSHGMPLAVCHVAWESEA